MELRDPDNPLAIEIQQEMAEAYFAACRKMVKCLTALKGFDSGIAAASSNHEQLSRRSELIDDAAERVMFVLIQREAMKLSGYEQFFEDYAVPDEVRRRLGTRRRR